MKKDQKLYIVKKYIYATSCAEAIKKDKVAPVDDCWMDDTWRQKSLNDRNDSIGFKLTKKK